MASDYYYSHHPYSSDDDIYYHRATTSSSMQQQQPPLPLHLCFFLGILLLFLTLSWYLSIYDSPVESLLGTLKLALMLLPVLLLLALHCLSGLHRSGWASLLSLPPPDPDWLYAGSASSGGSPWGVAAVLMLLIVLAAYRSTFRDGWFPLVGR